MQVIVIFTVFDTADEVRDSFKLLTNNLSKEFQWSILKQTWGIHRQAARSHIHITTVYECGEAKVWKILSDKIKRSKSWLDLPKPQKEVKYKISHVYSNDQKYNEGKALRYNLKEYTSNDQMWVDVAGRLTNLDTVFPGITQVEAETMREMANGQYEVVKEKRAKDEQDKLNNANKRLRLFEYIKARETINSTTDIYSKVQQVVCAILRFNKEEGTNFRLTALKDTAVNFLYQEGYITEIEICEYIHI